MTVAVLTVLVTDGNSDQWRHQHHSSIGRNDKENESLILNHHHQVIQSTAATLLRYLIVSCRYMKVVGLVDGGALQLLPLPLRRGGCGQLRRTLKALPLRAKYVYLFPAIHLSPLATTLMCVVTYVSVCVCFNNSSWEETEKQMFPLPTHLTWT